jgi:hypothetical protein
MKVHIFGAISLPNVANYTVCTETYWKGMHGQTKKLDYLQYQRSAESDKRLDGGS